MTTPCKACVERGEKGCCRCSQPFGKEYTAADGVFFKEMRVAKAGTLIPQHSHAYDHTSYLVAGAVEVEGQRYDAPAPIYIPAGKKHMFLTLEDNTFVLCVHNVSRSGKVQVLEEHNPFAEAA